MWESQPDLVICSGDLAMDAREREFSDAKRFLESLPRPQMVVPGNHDMPYFNPLRRFWVGLRHYKRIISGDLEPYYQDDELAVAGVNTARRARVRGGSISDRQVARLLERLGTSKRPVTRILVSHHPFDLPENYGARELVHSARSALARIECCVDLLLAGHMHISHAAPVAIRYRSINSQAVFIQAGTASSTRERGEPNSFNLIAIDLPSVTVSKIALAGNRTHYLPAPPKEFRIE